MSKCRLSVNAPLERAQILKKIGFDYIEPSNTDLMQMSPVAFREAAEEVKERGLLCEVIDNPIPCSVNFSDPDWNIAKWHGYLQLSAKRAKTLGAKYWCFGNGTSRQLSEDRKAETMAAFYEAAASCAEIGKRYGIGVIVEPLGPSVTNYLTSVEETVSFLDELAMENVYTMVDYRWEYEQGRPIEDLYKYANRIVHAHIDNPDTDYKNLKIRRVQTLQDGTDYKPFLTFVKSDAFSGVISIEANTFDDYETDLQKAMEFYRFHEMI